MRAKEKNCRPSGTRDKAILAIACSVLMALTLSVSTAVAESGAVVKLTGSRYMFFVITDLATMFMQDHLNSKVVVKESEPHTFVQSLADKTADAVMSVGKLDDDLKVEAQEHGLHLTEQVVGHGAVALITHPKNPVDELSLEQVRKMFLGEYRNWSQVGGLDEPIVTMSRDESVSGTHQFFQDHVLDGAPPAQETVRELDHDIVRAVWRRTGGIADARFTEAVRGKLKGMVKILAIKKDENSEAVLPSMETSRNGSYPLCFPLALYYDARAAVPTLTPFVQFCIRHGMGPHFAESSPQK
jgi:phosphate transport system substrate-binding protein